MRRRGLLRRYAPRNDGAKISDSIVKQREDVSPRSRGAIRPSFASHSTLLEAEGAGKAGCRLHPWVPCKKSTGVGPQVQPETSGFPCAMVYGLLRALPGDRALLPPSPRRNL